MCLAIIVCEVGNGRLERGHLRLNRQERIALRERRCLRACIVRIVSSVVIVVLTAASTLRGRRLYAFAGYSSILERVKRRDILLFWKRKNLR